MSKVDEKVMIALVLFILIINVLFDLSKLAERVVLAFLITAMIGTIALMVCVTIIGIRETIKELKNEEDKD